MSALANLAARLMEARQATRNIVKVTGTKTVTIPAATGDATVASAAALLRLTVAIAVVHGAKRLGITTPGCYDTAARALDELSGVMSSGTDWHNEAQASLDTVAHAGGVFKLLGPAAAMMATIADRLTPADYDAFLAQAPAAQARAKVLAQEQADREAKAAARAAATSKAASKLNSRKPAAAKPQAAAAMAWAG